MSECQSARVCKVSKFEWDLLGSCTDVVEREGKERKGKESCGTLPSSQDRTELRMQTGSLSGVQRGALVCAKYPRGLID